ncbi:MAG: hypothetical protein HYX73_08110 [Acidobacteria bacterium]|nr:hypothetical protein [Acidobacteriota bacterium]
MASKLLKTRKFSSVPWMSLALCLSVQPAHAQEIFAEPDQTLFTVMAAINAAGYDEGTDRTELNPVRAAVREDLAGLDIPSLAPLREFYAAHRLADLARDLSQYISLALLLSGPPKFELTLSPVNLPPDVIDLKDMGLLIAAFYEQASIAELWAKYLYDMEQDAGRYQRLLAKVIQETNGYLRVETPNYLGVRFAVYVNPLGAAGQTDVRNYGDNYYIISSPSTSLPEEQIRHAWLHYLLDPYVLKYPNIVKSKSELAQITQRAAALDPAFRNNFPLLLTESLIRAIQARLSGSDERSKLSAVHDSVEEGYLLTTYFYEAMEEFLDQPVGMRLYFPEMLDGISVDKEKKRLAEVQFRSVASRPAQEARWSPLEQMLRQAQEHLAGAEYEEARKIYDALSRQYGPQAAVFYGLALVASQQKQPELAKQYFTQAAALAYDPRMKAWSHIYLGRLLDLEGRREEAKLQYSAALSVGQLTADTKTAAEQGLETQFARPAEGAPVAPLEPEQPVRQRVPMGRPTGGEVRP